MKTAEGIEYKGPCKHKDARGNQFYGEWCPECEARNAHIANRRYPDKWYMELPKLPDPE